METAQERELLQLQGWPFHAVPAACFDAGSSAYTYSGGSSISSGGGGGCGDGSFLFGWEPPFGCSFGAVVAADAHLHDLFPLCMESLPVSPAATSTALLPEPPHAAVAMPSGELGDLFLNFWDASCAYAYDEQPVAINSSCVVQQHEHEKSSQGSSAATATNNPFLLCKKPLSERN